MSNYLFFISWFILTNVKKIFHIQFHIFLANRTLSGVAGFLLLFSFSNQLTAQTYLVKEIHTISNFNDGFHSPEGWAVMNDIVYFSSLDHTTTNRELWRTDGTEVGTWKVTEINPGDAGAFSINDAEFFVKDGYLYFRANDGRGRLLWRTDGTEQGTQLIQSVIDLSYTELSDRLIGVPRQFTSIGDNIYFNGDDGFWGYVGGELLSYNTSNGQAVLFDIWPGRHGVNGPYGSVPTNLTAVNNTLFFFGHDPELGTGLWTLENNVVGPRHFFSISQFATTPSSYIAYNNRFYFSGSTAEYGEELWVSDGSAEGTFVLKDIFEGTGSSQPNNMVVYNGELYFNADTPDENRELWKTDGTEEGTLMVAAVGPSPCNPQSGDCVGPEELTVFDGKLYFVFHTELFVTDGTQEGTKLLKSVNHGGPDAPNALAVAGDRLYFSADGGNYGQELWTSDGTPEGTYMVDNIHLTGHSGPRSFVYANNKVIFEAFTDELGWEVHAYEPLPTFRVSIDVFNPLGCDNQEGADLRVEISGGQSPYNFNWSHQDLEGQELLDLQPGTYWLTVTDAAGSANMTHVVIEQSLVTSTIEILISSTPATNEQPNGTATVEATGGAGDYSYMWSTEPIQTTPTATNLTAGTYSVTVTDAEGCFATTTVEVLAINDEICDDGIDNDGDGLVDCEDPDCDFLDIEACGTCNNDALSFADVVIDYRNTCANNDNTDFESATGVADRETVSLGDEGFIILGFTNNLLINSGANEGDETTPDLWVFERGPQVEGSFIELRPFDQATIDQLIDGGILDSDNDGYYEFGEIGGSVASIDLDQKIQGLEAATIKFDAIKIIDKPGNCSSDTPGADIDAVCALSSIEVEICEDGIDNDGDGLMDCDDPDCDSVCDEACGFSDEFEGTALDSRWIVINPNADSRIELNGEGDIEMIASPLNGGSDLWSGANFNGIRLLQPIAGDWIIEAKLHYLPTNDFEGAGFLLIADPDPSISNDIDVIRLNEYAFHGGGQKIRSVQHEMPYNNPVVYLRLEKIGTSFTSSHSSDEVNWIETGTIIIDDSIHYAGLSSLRQPHNGNLEDYSDARYEYFRFTSEGCDINIEQEEICENGIDDDNDGLIDCDDPDCGIFCDQACEQSDDFEANDLGSNWTVLGAPNSSVNLTGNGQLEVIAPPSIYYLWTFWPFTTNSSSSSTSY